MMRTTWRIVEQIYMSAQTVLKRARRKSLISYKMQHRMGLEMI